MKYIVGIDQSTQGTKAVLTDETGRLVGRADKRHRQLVNGQGWVSHDLEEIYQNVLAVVKEVLTAYQVSTADVAAIGISNQRETTAAWSKSGQPLGPAIVWQCARAKEIAEGLEEYGEEIREKTGLPLSPFFPAAKMAWLIANRMPESCSKGSKTVKSESRCSNRDLERETLGCLLGTMDAYLVYRLTNGAVFRTDLSNASRTQLFDIHTFAWDKGLCGLFGVPLTSLPRVCDSNGDFGTTTLEGFFAHPVPIAAVMGDSHGALFAQGCHRKGMVKTTYGTGSSIMMNIGEEYRKSNHGLATSLAWGMDGKVSYVLEGNINYTGAVITWLQEEMGLIVSPAELEPAIGRANPGDATVFVPAFTGLSAPHWDSDARALIYGMSRTTGRAELIKAAVESIAFQITDVLRAMEADSGIAIEELRVDGGPTRNRYLMQFQSDIAKVRVQVPKAEEFSALGAAYMAGLKIGMYRFERLFDNRDGEIFQEKMDAKEREARLKRWRTAVSLSRSR